MKTIILAEKPSVGKEIAKVLNCHQKGNGYFENNQYVVTWAMGHLVTLADPEHYFDAWKNWDLEYLPMLPDKMDLVVIDDVRKQYNIVKGLLQANTTKDLIIATDAGREGELVARWIIKKTNFRKPFKRLWISSLTSKSISEGFKNLKAGHLYDTLYYQAECRSIADWLVGLNVTRALTCKYNASLSAGRVQTPTLNMIINREEERRTFVPRKYYQLQIKVNNCFFNYVNNEMTMVRFYDHQKALEIANSLNKKQAFVKNIRKTMKQVSPPLLYDLTELQREGNKRFGYSPKKTLDIIQSLYEYHKYLTYPRTDSRHLTADMYDTIRYRLKELQFFNYQTFVNQLLKKPIIKPKRIFDDTKVTDHHAIIPTEEDVDISLLNKDELNIYNLVVQRFIAVFMSDFLYEQTEITLKKDEHSFVVKGRIVTELGFKSLSNQIENDSDEDDDENTLPNFSAKEYIIEDVKVNSLQTEPPKRFTEASLLTAMEKPQSFITDSKYRKILENCSGIGTPATRAEIIERLFVAGYIELQGKEIVSTQKGKQLISLIPKNLKSVELTAKWEEELNLIKENKINKDNFIKEIVAFTQELVGEVKGASNTYRHDNITSKTCPNCGKNLLKEQNKYGERLVCIDRNCGYKVNVNRITNARCPKCFKKLSVVGDDQKKYICACGFKMDFDKFNMQLSENKNNMNSKKIHSYLKEQDNEEKKIVSPFMKELEAMKKKL